MEKHREVKHPRRVCQQQLSAELQHIFQHPDIQARLLPLGYEISTTNAEQLRATVASDLDKWGNLAKTAGIKPE